MNFLFLRGDSHAQYEIRVYAEKMLDTVITNSLVPSKNVHNTCEYL